MEKGWKNFYTLCYNFVLKFWDEFNASFVLLYFSNYVLNKNVTPLSEKCGEKQQGSAFKVGPHLPFLKPFQYEETSCLGTQKELSIYFSVYFKLS